MTASLYKEIRKQAKQKVQAKIAFYICAIVFGFVSVILLMIGSYIPSVAFWLKLPLPVFIMVLGILYIQAFGLPMNEALSDDWQEEEIEKEMIRLYKKKKSLMPTEEDLSEDEILELKELERLEEKHDWREDY